MANRFGLKRFRDGEGGSATAEAVMWIPMYLIFISILIDAALLFHGQARVQRMAQDVNRMAVINYFKGPVDAANPKLFTVDETAMTTKATAMIQARYPSGSATVSTDDDSVQTFISVPASDITVIGLISKIMPITIKASAAQMREI